LAQLKLRGHEVNDIFDLLGGDENAITSAIAYALSRSSSLLALFLRVVLGEDPVHGTSELLLQTHESATGITDLELYSPGALHLILEAKRGWILPHQSQLSKYAGRRSFLLGRETERRIVTLSACSSEYASQHLPSSVKGVQVRHVSWRVLTRLAGRASRAGPRRERGVARDLSLYLRRITAMQNRQSNLVYVVSLSLETPRGWRVSWKDVVAKKRIYFHPMGAGWPKEPPTYIGFRYEGRLQSVHFIKSYAVIDNLHSACEEIPSTSIAPSFLYRLGPAIRPAKDVKTGALYRNGRVWCALDLLLTCRTIADARRLTEKRVKAK